MTFFKQNVRFFSVAFGGFFLCSTGSVLAENLYGAIAYSLEERIHGYATNFSSRDAAESEALANCLARLDSEDSSCSVELWFKNGYGALAEGDDGFGTGHGRYEQDAQLMALENCNNYTENCDISVTIGTD
ncbi:DUF4189 domain-containing protein [Thioflexithrix psekupsensis]|uniref:DUF4189 domain-containing protein n=1 Tax=Thioflexithrix psekupsensis TaxID=1570016 RepID=A0A251X7R5_9GAMM|nr:DUF4189 domain-containing protein [Thioflexithrix psekupsensis]OUD13249.1 hypothetical protein TPSD3_11495 [Thioflexithrix psekupsensis]